MTEFRLARHFSLSIAGAIVGVLFFAASLTPSLVPRSPLIQGAVSGVSLAIGYGVGVLLSRLFGLLQIAPPAGPALRLLKLVVLAICVACALLSLWWAAGWQTRLLAVMGMPPQESSGPLTIAAVSIAAFIILLLIARGFGFINRRLSARFGRYVPPRPAVLLAFLATAALFWSVGNGVLATQAMRSLDALYRELDARFEETSRSRRRRPRPAAPVRLFHGRALDGADGRWSRPDQTARRSRRKAALRLESRCASTSD